MNRLLKLVIPAPGGPCMIVCRTRQGMHAASGDYTTNDAGMDAQVACAATYSMPDARLRARR